MVVVVVGDPEQFMTLLIYPTQHAPHLFSFTRTRPPSEISRWVRISLPVCQRARAVTYIFPNDLELSSSSIFTACFTTSTILHTIHFHLHQRNYPHHYGAYPETQPRGSY